MRGLAIAVALVVCGIGPATAGPIDPFAFASLGSYTLGPGTYTITPTTVFNPFPVPSVTLTGPGVALTGVIYQDTPGHSLSVFDFSSFTLGAGASIRATGANPVVILSRSNLTINGYLDASGNGIGGAAGAGPANGGTGSSFSVNDQVSRGTVYTGGGGGGFGTPGGTTGSIPVITANGIVVVPGGTGGSAYGSLLDRLEGGGGGGTGGNGLFPYANGGGAIELGAAGLVSIASSGAIDVSGGSVTQFGNGGGAGGGVFIHGQQITVDGLILAAGGAGGGSQILSHETYYGGGNGGGGRVLIESFGTTPSVSSAAFTQPGSGFGVGSAPVVLLISTVPEPAALVALSIGMAAVTGLARLRRNAA